MTGGAMIGADIGGTFTDVVLVDEDGRMETGKYLTTEDDPTAGLLRGVSDILGRTATRPNDVIRVAHATTLATNVVLQRRGVPVAFVTTKGFRTMLTLGRSARVEESRFDLFFDAEDPPVPASHCFEVPGRILADGSEYEGFDEAAAVAVLDEIATIGVEAVAICLINSYVNPAHELRLAALARARLPEVVVAVSAEIWPELREYERATTTLMSAYVGPVMESYLVDLQRRLEAAGITAPVHIMSSSGGVMSAAYAGRHAVHTIESGPAAGVVSAQHIGAQIGQHDIISFDMGGTTAKAGVIREGRPDITRDFHVGGSGSFGGGREGTGVPIKVPVIDLAEVGAGGGSIASVDDAGSLRVGPHSAGANPGPACYGLGGELPTVTDANLVLGYLDPEFVAGGTVPLYPDRSRAALEEHVCSVLGIGLDEAAHAVHEIANANMGAAVNVVTVQRGVDPRRFALVALGGAGPMHAIRVADRFDIDTVVVPFGTGVGSAIGLLTGDITAERARTHVAGQHDVDFRRLDETFRDLATACADDLAADLSSLTVERSVGLRYAGQSHEIIVIAPPGDVGPAWMDELLVDFHKRYSEVYGKHLDGPVELVSAHVKVIQPVATIDTTKPAQSTASAQPAGARPAYFPEHGGHITTPVHARSDLPPGSELAGPAIIEEHEATMVLPPGWSATVDDCSNIVATRGVTPNDGGIR